MGKSSFYYEKCDRIYMSDYPSFLDKLKIIEKITKWENPQIASLNSDITCSKCSDKTYYRLANIVWSESVVHKITSHQYYPTEYFIMVILNTCVIDNEIINPPIQLNNDNLNNFSYIPLNYNKLLIIDALMDHGSYPQYEKDNMYIYSEHSGVITLKNKLIDTIIVSAETDRIDLHDKKIYLPNNISILSNHEYIFHTHPNATTYGGRINEGVLYEFPSANDIFNFIKYYNEGQVLASIIVAPEGIYVIRPIVYKSKYDIDVDLFYTLRKFIFRLEQMAIEKVKNIAELSNPDIFHTKVSCNFKYIKIYNKMIRSGNLFIEFYPREKKNGEWRLMPINLQYIKR
jgi:hypothetical protein